MKRLAAALGMGSLAAFIANACVVSDKFDDAQFLCDPKGGPDECPPDMLCGGDGLCRHQSAKFDGSAGGGGTGGSCFPTTCESLAPKCGDFIGCTTLHCGCTAPKTCGGGTVADECGCTNPLSIQKSGTAAFQVATSGSVDWTNLNNALLSDDQYASTAAAMASGKITSVLKISAFGFSLPPTAIVDGVVVTIERSSANGAIKDGEVRLLVAGSPLSEVGKSTTAWGTSDAEATYGSATDLWGATSIDPTNVKKADFGVSITATATASDSPRLDAVKLTVFYDDLVACPKP